MPVPTKMQSEANNSTLKSRITHDKRLLNGTAVTVPGKSAGITLSGEINQLLWGKVFVEILSGQTPFKGNRVADDGHTYAVVADSDAVVNLVSFQLSKSGNSPQSTCIFNELDGQFDFNKKFCVGDFIYVSVKSTCKSGIHSRFNDFITCSRLTKPELRDSSIILTKTASSYVSVSTPSASNLSNTFSSSSSVFASSISEKAYSPNSSLASSRVSRYSGDLSGLFVDGDRRGFGVAAAVSIGGKFVSDAAKVKTFFQEKVKFFAKKFGDSNSLRIFVAELTLNPSFKAFFVAAFFVYAFYLNSLSCCFSKGSCYTALLTGSKVKENDSFFLFTNFISPTNEPVN